MTRNENQMYSDITSIRKSLEKIANALDNNVTQTSKDIPGFEGTLDALDNLCNVGTNPKNDPERDKFDDDDDLRCTVRMYDDELLAGNFNTKKECILDYVTNEFGSQGARYTDIIKFAYYLNNPNSPKFGYENRGYYSCAMTHNHWGFGHLVYGGKDHFVKGINKEGNEKYFALSFVESVTDYWKYCDNRKQFILKQKPRTSPARGRSSIAPVLQEDSIAKSQEYLVC